jgi:hypothetical protein
MVAAKLATLKDGQKKQGGQNCLSQPDAAEMLGVSTRTVKQARVVQETAGRSW